MTAKTPQKQQVLHNGKFISRKELVRLEAPLLLKPDLLSVISDQFARKIEGEERNRIAIFLNGCGAWVLNAEISSYNLCVNSNSGAGKDYTCKAVLDIFPKWMVHKRSRITPTAFTYWHNSNREPDWTWDNKILLLSDISSNVLNSEVFKLMCSDGTHSTVVIKQFAVDIKINGKPVIFITAASAYPNNEMLRRFPILELDESQEQTENIKRRQAQRACDGLSLDYDREIVKSFSHLQRVKVRIPFADVLVDKFPSDHLLMRTHFSRLLDLIKASAALHQYQRNWDEEDYVIADHLDYDNAADTLQATTSNPRMIPLTKRRKMLLEVCKRLDSFNVMELEPEVPFMHKSKIYDNLAWLQEHGFLSSQMMDVDERKKPVRFYKYQPFELTNIPKWKEIAGLGE